MLCEFIKTTLTSVVAERSSDNSTDGIDVSTLDILKALENQQDLGPRVALSYLDQDIYSENPIVLNSDSEDFSDESSVDSDWVDGPITDLDDDDQSIADEEDVFNDDPLHSIIQESLKKCVVHAQSDAKPDPEDDEINGESSDGDSIDTQISEFLDTYWDTTIENAPGHDDKTAYYMPKNLVEEAVTYAGEVFDEDHPTAQLFIHKYEDDIPFHDMPEDDRNKMLELRKQTNRMIKEQCDQEFDKYLQNKYSRLSDNFRLYHSTLRSDALECKTMILDLNNYHTLEQTILTASKIIRDSSALNSIKLQNFLCRNDAEYALISQLMTDIVASPSIQSIVIFSCYFKSYEPLANLIRNKQIKTFHLMAPLALATDFEDEFLAALEGQESIKDLMLPLEHVPNEEKYVKTMNNMVHRLDIFRPYLVMPPK